MNENLFENSLIMLIMLGFIYSMGIQIFLYRAKRHKHNHPVNQAMVPPHPGG